MKKLLLVVLVGFVFGITTNGYSQTRTEGIVVELEVVSIDYVRAILEDNNGKIVKTKKIKKEKVAKGDHAKMDQSDDSREVDVSNERMIVRGEILEMN